jgi:hypothetical protein
MLKGLGIPDDTGKPEDFTITVGALLKKRADIVFEIGRAERQAEKWRTDLIHLDAVLRLFRPDFKAIGMPVRRRKPVKSPHFKHGEVRQRIYDALRTMGSATTVDLATAAIRDKGLVDDLATRTDLTMRFRLQLNVMHRAGQLERTTEGKMRRWKLASQEPELGV